MVLPHRARMAWRLKQVLYGLASPLSKSGVTLLARDNTLYGTMWHRNVLGVVPCGLYRKLYTFSGTILMQRNQAGSGNGGETQKEKLLPSGLITTPQNIQVFADPTLTKCVRDLACDMQKVKSTLKFNKEEVADCVYEYIRLNNAYDSLKAAAKDSSKITKELTKEVEGNARLCKDKHKELENCLLYFTEKTVKHENQMLDISQKQEEIMKRIDEFVSNLDFVVDEVASLRVCVDEEVKPKVARMEMLADIFGAEDGSVQVDVKRITEDLVRIRKLLNDVGDCGDSDWIDAADGNKPKTVNSEGEGPYLK